jgi:hypothetical protein
MPNYLPESKVIVPDPKWLSAVHLPLSDMYQTDSVADPGKNDLITCERSIIGRVKNSTDSVAPHLSAPATL